MPVFQGQVGTQGVADGTYPNVRMDKFGGVVVTELNARYYEQAYRGNMFQACNSASQALSLNSTTATGLILTNPPGSTKNVVLIELCIALLTAPAGISSLILTGNLGPNAAVTHTTPLVVRPAVFGSAATALALVDSAATMPALTIFRPVGGGPVATGSVTAPFIKDEIAGTTILGPGTTISLQCLTTAISVIASMTWMELPV